MSKLKREGIEKGHLAFRTTLLSCTFTYIFIQLAMLYIFLTYFKLSSFLSLSLSRSIPFSLSLHHHYISYLENYFHLMKSCRRCRYYEHLKQRKSTNPGKDSPQNSHHLLLMRENLIRQN